MPNQKPHVSFSQISTMKDCPKRWMYTRTRSEDDLKNLNLVLGGCFHHALAFNFVQKITTNTDLPIKEILEAFKNEWVSVIAKGEWMASPKENKDDIFATGEKMLIFYMKNVAYKMMPVKVEKRFTVNLPDTKYQLVGYVDFIGTIIDGPYKDKMIIVDFKTMAKSMSNKHRDKDDKGIDDNPVYVPNPNQRIQLATYLFLVKLANQELGAEYEDRLTMIQGITKAVTTKLCEAYYEVEDGDLQAALNEISWLIGEIERNKLYPNFNAMYCTENGCAWYEECHRGEGRSTESDLVEKVFAKLGISHA